MSDADLPLAADFDPVTFDDWADAAERAMRGADLASLTTTTADGIERLPLYSRDRHGTDSDPAGLPGAGTRTRGSTAAGTVTGWEIRQSHDARLADVTERILTDLERGVTAITLVDAPDDVDTLDRVLTGVHVDLAPIRLAAGSGDDAAGALMGLWSRREVPDSVVAGSLGADPLGEVARTGHADDLDGALARAAERARIAVARFDAVTALVADGAPYADAGASDSEEIACVVATGVAYLRAMENAGIDIGDAAGTIELSVTVGADQFLAIAKLRALRRLWARVLDVSGVPDAPMTVHAVTAGAMMTRRDPWVNMLRTTAACFAAAVGGADAITVQPFDVALGVPDEFGLRIARNTQSILAEESQLGRVVDPAGGSWYAEDLTDQLAVRAWSLVAHIEERGTMTDPGARAWVTEHIVETRAARDSAIATRAVPITGVSEFPHIDEELLARPAAPGADVGGPLAPSRYAAPFEALRDAADAADDAPTIFLANLGPIATHNARSTFAKNLFEAGGIRAIGNDGFDDPDEVAAAFTGSAAPLAVICSSDAVYEDSATGVAAALQTAGATRVWLAGAPGDRAAQYRAAGIDGFVHLGCDVLATLRDAHDALAAGR